MRWYIVLFSAKMRKNERGKKPSGKLILSHSDHNLPLGIVLEKSQFGLVVLELRKETGNTEIVVATS